jgi:hypothetical protein
VAPDFSVRASHLGVRLPGVGKRSLQSGWL